MHQGQIVPGEETFNGIDMAWRQFKSFFRPRRREQPGLRDSGTVNRDGYNAPATGASAASAIPSRLTESHKGTSSAPSSPAGGRRKAEMDPRFSIQEHRSLSAPPDGLNAPEEDATPILFTLLGPMLHTYAPMLTPYAERGRQMYEQFRDGDQKSFWLTHAFIALILLYFLSAMLVFLFKMFVFVILMYSTGWTVYTSELFNHNEAIKKYAYIATGLLGLYLFAIMN